MTLSFSQFISTLESLSSHVSKTSGSYSAIGDHLQALTKEHTNVLDNLVALVDNFEVDFSVPIKQKCDQVKQEVQELDKSHIKSFKKMFSSYSNKKKDLSRLETKLRKSKKNTFDLQSKRDFKIREIEVECKVLEEEERKQISTMSLKERDLYQTIGNGLRKLFQKELNIFSQHFDISRELLKLNEALTEVPETDFYDEVKDDYEGFIQVTPPSSPTTRSSMVKSLSGSMLSLTSLVDDKLRIKKRRDSEVISLAEVAEFLTEDIPTISNRNAEEFQKKDDHVAEGPDGQWFGEIKEVLMEPPFRTNLESNNSFVGRATEGGRSTSFCYPSLSRPVRPRFISESIIETNVEDHIKFLDNQNDLIINIFNENSAVDQMLNPCLVMT